MKKKTFLTLLPLFIVAALCMTLTSCGGGDDSDDPVPPTPANNGGSSGAGGSLGYDSGVAPDGAQTIDLGLPSGTLWANMNVGATTAEGAGLYFAWGEITGYGNNTSDGRLFDSNSYKYASESYPYVLKYCTQSENGTVDNKIMLELADDAARANWKGDWRMPTRDEFQELLDNTTQEQTTQNGVSGIKLTSKSNGNSIFFPAIGYRLRDEIILYGEGAWYWTSSLDYDKYSNKYLDYNATAFGFGKNSTLSKTYDGRTYGLNVRAVIGKAGEQPTDPKESEPTYPETYYTPFTLEAISDGAITFKNAATGVVTYKIDNNVIQSISAKSTKTINVVAGQKICFYGNNTTYTPTTYIDALEGVLPYDWSRISSNTDFYAYGNIMSLINSTDFTTANIMMPDYAFDSFFYGNTHLMSHPSKALVLPAMAEFCYSYMFEGCTSLTTAPVLPATTLAGSCYRYMFKDCTSLTTPPELPAKTLANCCYDEMFSGCKSLRTAPALPVKTLAYSCYSSMFSGCTSLTSAPELPATTLTACCYISMFSGCTSLTSAPELPATTLAKYCYNYMFSGCKNLKYVKCLAKNDISGNCDDWLNNVASTGTFVKASGTSWTGGTSGIPYGWTVQEK